MAWVGENIMVHWSRFSGHAVFTLHMLLLALFTPRPHSSAVQLNKIAAVQHGLSRRLFDCHNNDYVTKFHLAAGRLSRTCSQALLTWLCGLLNACHRMTITYRHTDATDSPMFSLAPMLPMSDVRIGLTLRNLHVPNNARLKPSMDRSVPRTKVILLRCLRSICHFGLF